MSRHDDTLRLLAAFHWVVAGLSLLFSAIPLLYVWMGVAMARGTFTGKGTPPPAPFGWAVAAIGVAFLVAVVGFAVGLAWAGRCLARRRAWLYCMVMAGLACAFFPFGTALGVFTIVTLSQPEVKALFGRAEAAPEAPGGGW